MEALSALLSRSPAVEFWPGFLWSFSYGLIVQFNIQLNMHLEWLSSWCRDSLQIILWPFLSDDLAGVLVVAFGAGTGYAILDMPLSKAEFERWDDDQLEGVVSMFKDHGLL